MMTARNIFVLFFSLFLFTFSHAQKKSERRILAKEQIAELKNGVLLVRLQNKQTLITHLKKQGMEKQASAVENRVKKQLDKQVGAFKTFNFTQVYFFYAHHSQHVKDKKWSEVTFLDSNFKAVNLEPEHYFIGEFGNLPKNYQHQEVEKDSNFNPQKSEVSDKKYQGGANTGIESFYLMDKNFNLLQKPFPYYQRFRPIPLTKLSEEEVIEKWSEKLYKFLSA